MSIIQVRQLTKAYRVYKKREGLGESIRGLFHREYKEVHAVRGIDLDVEQGELVAFLRRRRQSGQVERGAADEREWVGLFG